MTSVRLNPDLDPAALAARFAVSGRMQIDDFLVADDARRLAASLEGLPWNLVLNSAARHIDLNEAQIASAGPERMAAIMREVETNAAERFQYLYDAYPVADLADAGRLDHAGLAAALNLLNSTEVRDTLEAVTGRATHFCDMQATRYRPGHFLTVHDDNAGPTKNRKLAYVLSLTEGWSPIWGGQLQFVSDGKIVDAFAPRFNALSVFAVPFPHHVSQVASFAPKPRLSLTGWFRTKS